MARFNCDRCGFDGHRAWTGGQKCPACGETYKLRVAIGMEGMTDAEFAEFEKALAGIGAE